MTDHDIEWKQEGKTYTATSRMTIFNPENQTFPTIVLYLNPGLEVTEVMMDNKNLTFHREHQVLVVESSLLPKESKEITIRYRGGLSPDVCYAEIGDLRSQEFVRSYYIFNLGREFFYLQPDFTLLTPECLWYPVSFPPVNLNSPYTTLQAYTRFRLSVVGEKVRVPVSQGNVVVVEDTIRFVNENKLPGLSLCLGNFTRKSIVQDSVSYEVYLFKGHEYLVEQFDDPLEIIDSWRFSFGEDREYTFKKLALVETPVHFCAYSRFWRDRSEYVQPELIFRPEREALNYSRFKVGAVPTNVGISPSLEAFMIYWRGWNLGQRTIRKGSLFLGEWFKTGGQQRVKDEYDLSFLLRKNYFQVFSSEFPGIDLIFQEMLGRWETVCRGYRDVMTYKGALPYLEKGNLSSAFSGVRDDVGFQQLIWGKSSYFLRQIFSLVPYRQYHDFHQKFIKEHQFETVRYEQYCDEFKALFGIDLIVLTRQLFDQRGLPSFWVRDFRVELVEKDGSIEGYVLHVKIWNRSKVEGIITLSGSGWKRDIHCLIPSEACKEIRYFFAENPRKFDFEVQTNLSQNIPACYSFNKIKPTIVLQKPSSGIFDVDTASFFSVSEYIVDNEDVGFRVIESVSSLKEILKKEKKSGTQSRTAHMRWTCYDDVNAYGEPVRTYYRRIAGDGSSGVEWETSLRDSGKYELFIYNDDFAIEYGLNFTMEKDEEVKAKEPTQTYRFAHKGGEEEVVIETATVGSGWVSLGKYEWNAGPAKVTLSDKGADSYQVIQADAVKWVKLK